MEKEKLKLAKLLTASFILNILSVALGLVSMRYLGEEKGLLFLIALVIVVPPVSVLVLKRWRW